MKPTNKDQTKLKTQSLNIPHGENMIYIFRGILSVLHRKSSFKNALFIAVSILKSSPVVKFYR